MTGFIHGHGVSAEQLPSTLGPQLSAASLSITFASDASGLPISLNDGTGHAITSQVNGSQRALDVGVNVAGVQVDPRAIRALTSADAVSAVQSGVWNVTNVSGTVSLPTGAATAALQTSGNASLTAIAASVAGTLAVSAAALPLPAGAATETTLAAVNTKLAGTLTVTQASQPLPTGAATETTLAALSAKHPATLGQKLSSASMAVVLPADQSAIPVTQSGTWTVSGISGTVSLPTGAATETTLAAASAKLPATLGQKAMANSLSVAIASDQGSFPTSVTGIDYNSGLAGATTQRVVQAGRAAAFIARNDYSSTAVTTGAYVTFVASTSAATTRLRIFDSSGSALKLATGAAASEVDILYIPPGGADAPYEVNIPAGTRLSLKAADSNATSGQLLVSAFA